MVNSNLSPGSQRLDAVFQALADPTRRAILRRVAREVKTVGEIADPLTMSLAAVSKHLKVLERADLIVREKRGSFQLIGANPRAMRQAHEWLGYYEQFWGEHLDALAETLARKQRKAK
jgi:DNA-binding transcriptional ArsR family regulator